MPCPAAVAGLVAALGLSACTEAPRGQPSFYRDLGSPGAVVDAETARAMISAYRLNNGQQTLVLDAGLQASARAEASAMAAADKPASAERIKAKLTAAGIRGAEANVSAGYRTLAEAFSGWRESAQHDRVMKAPQATRMGIATAHAPGSKYQVYWVLLVAPPG